MKKRSKRKPPHRNPLRGAKRYVERRSKIVEVISQDPFTMAKVEYQGIQGVGFAKRLPWEPRNEALGVEVAMGRANKRCAWAWLEAHRGGGA